MESTFWLWVFIAVQSFVAMGLGMVMFVYAVHTRFLRLGDDLEAAVARQASLMGTLGVLIRVCLYSGHAGLVRIKSCLTAWIRRPAAPIASGVNVRRGTRGMMRKIRRKLDITTSLHVEADNLLEIGIRNDRDLVEIRRRLRQIAFSAGIEFYADAEDGGISITKTEPPAMTELLAETVINDALSYCMTHHAQTDRENLYNDRLFTMMRLRHLSLTGGTMGWLGTQFLRCKLYLHSVFGSTPSRPVA